MSLARQFLQEFRPLFRMLEEPLTRSPVYFGGLPARSVFDDPFFQKGQLRPAVDLSEEGQNYIVEAELPGVLKENVEVSVGEGGRSLTIEGKIVSRREAVAPPTNAATSQIEGKSDGPNTASTTTAVAQPQDTSAQISSERAFTGSTTFTRTVWLPRPVDGANVTAKLADGILTVTIPKAEDKASFKVPVL